MVETCLSYLNSREVKALPPWSNLEREVPNLDSSHLQSTPFIRYSSVYWGRHAKRELSDRAKLLAMKLFDDHKNQTPIQILLEEHGYYGFYAEFHNFPPFSGLHCASLFGIIEIVASLVEVEGCDVNQEDCVGNTPLLWAILCDKEYSSARRLSEDLT